MKHDAQQNTLTIDRPANRLSPTSRRDSIACHGTASLADRDRPRRDLDSRRARSDARRRRSAQFSRTARRSTSATSGRRERDLISDRRGRGRDRVWYATDRLGRKKLFFVTVAVYLVATAATAFSWNFASYVFFRALTGAGIGGEYAAINSAIDELIPARIRGRVDLMINGTYWIGAALERARRFGCSIRGWLPVSLGWRFAFGIGAVLGLIVIFFRQWVPESPRWLMIHGREEEAEAIVRVGKRQAGRNLPPPPNRRRGSARAPTPRGARSGRRSRTSIGAALFSASSSC